MHRNGIILVWPSNWEEMNMSQEEEVDSPNGDKRGDKKGKELEEKMESLIWQMNMFIACVVCFVVGCVLMYVVRK